VATSKSTVTAVAVAVIPLLSSGGVFKSGVVGSISSVEQLVKNPIPKSDITVREPDFFKNSLLSSDNDPVLMFFMESILPFLVYG
jgi:CRISPR/Cas system-associated protein Cas5 (RAMP superfamily)